MIESVILDHNIISFLLSYPGKRSCKLKEIKVEFKSGNFSKEERLFNRRTYISQGLFLFSYAACLALKFYFPAGKKIYSRVFFSLFK